MQAAALSDVGLIRPTNEDALYCDVQRGIFIIADGIGGSQAGEIAANLAIEVVSERLTLAVDMGNIGLRLPEVMHDAFSAASEEVYKRGQESEDLNGMACSLIAAVIESDNCVIGHVGDARAYLFYGGSLHQITVDDTPVAAMVKRGYLLPEKARNHILKNSLLKSIGNKQTIETNISRFPVKPKERLLFCSDGLWAMLEDRRISEILTGQSEPQQACRELINAARESGGRDNITVILVEFEHPSDVIAIAGMP